jgi:DNA polymerase-3 subunit epsilon
MTFAANFTAIDFETANRRRDSACQLAAVVVRDGQIVDERMWMIRPDPFFFSAFNIRVHGIHPQDVEHEASFGELWDEIADVLGSDCLIAHNAPFDIGVLIGCIERHRLAIPDLHFSCTRLISKQTWPDRGRYGLKPLATWLGVEFRHHDALEDSRACAKLLLAAGIAKQAASLEDLEQRLRIERGTAGTWGVKQAGRKDDRSRKRTSRKPVRRGAAKRTLRGGGGRPLRMPFTPFEDAATVRQRPSTYSAEPAPVPAAQTQPAAGIDFQRVLIRAEFIQPLRGKHVVFRGRLTVMSIEQASELTRRCGGVFQSEADRQTNCVVVGGEADPASIDADASGATVEVFSEAEFLKLLGG